MGQRCLAPCASLDRLDWPRKRGAVPCGQGQILGNPCRSRPTGRRIELETLPPFARGLEPRCAQPGPQLERQNPPRPWPTVPLRPVTGRFYWPRWTLASVFHLKSLKIPNPSIPLGPGKRPRSTGNPVFAWISRICPLKPRMHTWDGTGSFPGGPVTLSTNRAQPSLIEAACSGSGLSVTCTP